MAAGESCTFHPEVPADGRCSSCGRPFCKSCLTFVQPPHSVAGSGATITVGGGYGGLLCIECRMKGQRIFGFVLAGVGLLAIIMVSAFFASVPSWSRGFFSAPLAFGFLMGLGMVIFGAFIYTSVQGKIADFQSSLPLKAKFPAKAELGVAKCPNCGAVLKSVPQQPGEVIICEYCGTHIVNYHSS